jgi:pimeloyl-ACP methyl ester carboxylesterase
MDVAASWQFMVESFSEDFFQSRRILAADWRGYGLTQGPATDSFWLPDYLGDLDALLIQMCPDQSIDLVGHSMGGNVVMMYSGARPDRIRRLINLEGFGMSVSRPSQAPGRLGQWLDELQAFKKGELDLKAYPDAAAVAQRLMKTNQRLSQDKADWLAQHWAQPDAQAAWALRVEPALGSTIGR